jgi:hypothetical protein
MLFKNLIAASIAASLEIFSPALAAESIFNPPLPVSRPATISKSVASKAVRPKHAYPKRVKRLPSYIERIISNIGEMEDASKRPVPSYNVDLDLNYISRKNVKSYVVWILKTAIYTDFETHTDQIIDYCNKNDRANPISKKLCKLFDEWLVDPERPQIDEHSPAPGVQGVFGRPMRAAVGARFAAYAPA